MEQKKQEHGHKDHKTFPASVEPENSLAARMPELAAQWDVEKNAPLAGAGHIRLPQKGLVAL